MSDVIRVLIADDSATVRHYLQSLIREANGFEIVGEARDGEEVVQMAQKLRPDVISMDIHMPRQNGLEATREIMGICPTPVVVVSGMLEDDIQLSLQALEAGALAVVSKPPDRANPDFPARRQQLITTLRAMAGVRVISRRDLLTPDYSGVGSSTEPTRRTRPELVVIGASTGGPSALHRLLQGLPNGFPVPIAIVQHMPHEFIPGLARWLDRSTSLEVKVAEEGMILRRGLVVIAPGNAHLLIARQGTNLVAQLQHAQGGERYQPSVDLLFDSVARVCGSAALGVVLTGMGEDGAEGLLAMRRAGARTLAQDEASSTVFGMPQAALSRGATRRAVSLSDMAVEIVNMV